MSNEIKAADDRARKSTADAERLANELRSEQEHSMQIEKQRKSIEGTVKDLQIRLDEAEGQALKGGKKIIAKLEQRVRLKYFFTVLIAVCVNLLFRKKYQFLTSSGIFVNINALTLNSHFILSFNQTSALFSTFARH